MDFKVTNDIDIDLDISDDGIENSIYSSFFTDEGLHWSNLIKSKLWIFSNNRMDNNIEYDINLILNEFCNLKKKELNLKQLDYKLTKMDSNNLFIEFQIIKTKDVIKMEFTI